MEGEIYDDQTTPPPQDGREKIRESLRIERMHLQSGDGGILDLLTLKRPRSLTFQSALATARIISGMTSQVP